VRARATAARNQSQNQINVLWTPNRQFANDPFETEAESEGAVVALAPTLFGPLRIYLDTKKRIGTQSLSLRCREGTPYPFFEQQPQPSIHAPPHFLV